MKKSELAKGMRVGIARARDWVRLGVDEAYVLDIVDTYVYPRNNWNRDTLPPVIFDDPLNPGQTVTKNGIRAARNDERGAIAILKRSYMGANKVEWQVDLIGLAQIAAPYEDAMAAVNEVKARRDRDARLRSAARMANEAAFAELKLNYPMLDTYKVRLDVQGDVSLPLDLLKALLVAVEVDAR